MLEGIFMGIGIAFLIVFIFAACPRLFFGMIESLKITRTFRERRRKARLVEMFKRCSNIKAQNDFVMEVINYDLIPVNKKDLLIILELLSDSGELRRIHGVVLDKIRAKRFKLTDEDMSFIVNCYQSKLEKKEFDILFNELIEVHEAVR